MRESEAELGAVWHELGRIQVQADSMSAFNQAGHLFECIYFGLRLLLSSLLIQEFCQDRLLSKLGNRKQQCVLVTFPGVVLSNYVVNVIDLVFTRELPLL